MSKRLQEKLDDLIKWYYYNHDTIEDVEKRLEFYDRAFISIIGVLKEVTNDISEIEKKPSEERLIAVPRGIILS